MRGQHPPRAIPVGHGEHERATRRQHSRRLGDDGARAILVVLHHAEREVGRE